MRSFPAAVERLTEQFNKLPGVGFKSAQRMAFHVLGMNDAQAEAFAQAILDAKHTVKCCEKCQNLTDMEVCSICSDPGRDQNVICVVTEPRDVAAMERAREYKGLYHVLHGVISPINHVGPDDIRVKELLGRLSDGTVTEIIMATNPDTEGEATAMYISRLIRPLGVKVTRLAYGIPVGSQLEYADEVTLMRALEGRREI
ncbi:MAG: recombination protein RecR [Oscillospiraceae bacterium]|nr:recombination protein RecR [Oscillospiraceae bacterium]